MYDFWLYQGSDSERNTKPPGSIVLDFVNRLIATTVPEPYIVLADSFYSSLKLAIQLHRQNLGCLLSCRTDRPTKLWKPLQNKLSKKQYIGIESQVNQIHKLYVLIFV